MTLSRILKASLILLALWPILLWFAAWLGWQPLFLFLSVIALIPALASFYALRLAQHAGRWVEKATRAGLVLCAGFNVAMLLLVVLSALGQQQGIHIVNVTLLFVMIAAVVTLSLVAHLNSKFAGAASQFVAGLGMISLFFMAVLLVGSWMPELSGAVVGQIRRAEDRLFWNVGTTQATYYVTVRETTQRDCLGCKFDKVNRAVSLPSVDNDKAFGERVTIPSGRWFLAAGPSNSRIFKEGLDWVPVLAANDNNPRRGFEESRVLLVIKNDLHPDDPFTANMSPPVTKAPEDNKSVVVPDQQPAPPPAVQTQQSIQGQAPEPSQPLWTDRVIELPGVAGSHSYSSNVKVIPTTIRVEQNDTRITFLVDGSDSRDGQICPDSEKNTFILDNQGKRYKFLGAHWECRQVANGERFGVDEIYEKLDDDVAKVSLFFDNVKMDFSLNNREAGISANDKNFAPASRVLLGTSSSAVNIHGTLLSVEKIEVGLTDTKVFFRAVGIGSSNDSICRLKNDADYFWRFNFLSDVHGSRFNLLFDPSEDGCRDVASGEVVRFAHIYEKLNANTDSLTVHWSELGTPRVEIPVLVTSRGRM